MPASTTSLQTVLNNFAADPGRPRLTWYGTDGERVELSGAVLANWVAKTTNLLVEELDAEPGTVVDVDLPPHWRTLVWALGTWQSGATVRLGADGAPGDVVVTDVPGRRAAGRAALVVVSLPALARRFDGDLPRGAIDAAAAVMTYGDTVGYLPPHDPSADALVGGGVAATVSHADLLGWADHDGSPEGSASTDDGTQTRGGRLLLALQDATARTTGTLLRTALASWHRDGSVVVLAPDVAAELAADPARADRLVETERVTHRA
ncbi:TIGR03089 family protein [Sanguibacter suaedae]|uniref:TIGR03089 family protein n=1 Tax=Sanguibacter suaedae TaxID=2795737 RepID=A0A934M6Z2_9MICO|nr:TIGR03089 family protein [Sanguibacter suaedae]MBI9114792.1 TIGR03089 family protein [Sanguibacter suaedae]